MITFDTVRQIALNPSKRAFLLEAEPDAFFITDDYRDCPRVLARLRSVTLEQRRGLPRANRGSTEWRGALPFACAECAGLP